MRLPIDTEEIELKDRYEGWKLSVRTNPPMRVLANMASGNFTKIAEGLSAIVTSWNFVDEDGNPLPSPPTSDTILDLPTDLITAISQAYFDAVSALNPK